MKAIAYVLVSGALAVAVFACGGSDSGSVKQEETSPTTPTGSSGTSGASGTSGTPSTSGTSGTPSTSGTSGMPSTSGGMPDAGGADAGNCVAKGYAGNEKKIGAYCDNDTACPFQVDPFLVCTAGHDPTNTHLFCTSPCQNDSQCGTGAYCMHDTAGAGCVPTQCGGAPGM